MRLLRSANFWQLRWASSHRKSDESALLLSTIYQATINGYQDIIRLLHDNKAHLNVLDSSGSNAMLWAIFEGKKDAALNLRELSADVNIKNKMGMSATQFLDEYPLHKPI